MLYYSCSDPVSPEQAALDDIRSRVARIMPYVADIREMDFIRPVYSGVIVREAYISSVKQSIAASLSDAEEKALAVEYAQMCFLPESDTPLTSVLSDFYGSFPAAFYRMGTDSLYIIPNAEHDDFQLDMIVAHELTHALQDQHFTMRPVIFPTYSTYNNDANLAWRALVEGDAVFTEMVYGYATFYRGMNIPSFDSARVAVNEYRMDILHGTYSADPPVFLDIETAIPYFLGASLVAEKYHLSKSWEPINALYSISTIPRSVAEINSLDAIPVTYFDFHSIQNLLIAEPGNIEFADDDNAGFALLLGLLYRDGNLAYTEHSFSWRGDRYTFVKRTGQRYGTLVWAMAFSTADAAHYLFEKIVSKITARQLSGETATIDSLPDSADVTYSFASAVMTTTLKRVGNEIWWLENTGNLTQPILDLLQQRYSGPSLAKVRGIGSFPYSLSHETKNALLMRLLNYLMR